MHALFRFLSTFRPHPSHARMREKIKSGLAGGLAILMLSFALHQLPQPHYPILLLGSMAASAALLFAAPHSPFSQPWNLVGGHAISALAGWLCLLLIPDPLLAGGIAVGAAIFMMYALNCLHPPGAATALTLVMVGEPLLGMGWSWIAMIVLANASLSLLLALLINNLLVGRRYPATLMPAAPPQSAVDVVANKDDIEWALKQQDDMPDISIDELTDIYTQAQERAKARLGRR